MWLLDWGMHLLLASQLLPDILSRTKAACCFTTDLDPHMANVQGEESTLASPWLHI